MLLSELNYLLALAASVVASPLATQGSDELIKERFIITADNTINGTFPLNHPQIQDNSLRFNLINNYDNERQMHAYVTGKDRSGHVVMLSTSGQFYYPNTTSETPVLIPNDAEIAIPLNSGGHAQTSFTIPDSIVSGRVYIADGDLRFSAVFNKTSGELTLVQPSPTQLDSPSANIKWGFMELTNTDADGITVNLSFVDWVSLVMGMRLTLGDGQVKSVPGLEPDALSSICTALRAQSDNDGQSWDKLCVSGKDDKGNQKLLRVLSPNLYTADHGDFMANYYSAYVDNVYAKYTNEDLIIDTQRYGLVSCRTQGETQLFCQGDSIPFPKPAAKDIWGCNSGPFVNLEENVRHMNIVARLCAAFTRTQLLLPGGNITPALGLDSYYTVDPTNHYSRIVHNYEIGGLGYAFPYDDVHPNDATDASGTLSGHQPQLLEIFIGGGL